VPEVDVAAARARAQAAWDKAEALSAAGDRDAALAWMGRAHRLAPADQNLCFALARLRLQAGDAAGAAALFARLTRQHEVRECWIGLAAASLMAGHAETAVMATRRALGFHAVDASAAAVARRVSRVAGAAGWCGLRADAVVLAEADGRMPTILLDGVAEAGHAAAAGGIALPARWRQAATLQVFAGEELIGSPIDLASLRRVEGFAERDGDMVRGWAWHPGAPELDPVLEIRLADGGASGDEAPAGQLLTAREIAEVVDGIVPLARPRAFRIAVPAGQVARVVGFDGRDLLGSPVAPLPAPFRAPAPAAPRRRAQDAAAAATDVVIPVYRGLRATLDCIGSVLAAVPPASDVWVVDDASPEPALVAALEAMAAEGTIRLIRTVPGQRGFPAAVNAGLAAIRTEHRDRHVVLLNADTLVAPGWLEMLRAAACSAADIGTATPLSNEASIFSTPDPAGGNPAPDLAGTRVLAALAAQANAGRLVDVPTAHGFCMFIRRDCLEETGAFEAGLFAQGYGEENDFTERAAALGWRHVAVPGVYVAHLGGVSFGAARHHLLQRNLALLERRHPGYRAKVEAYLAGDALQPARRRLEAARFRAAQAAAVDSVLLVTHGGGGGTARIVAERAEDIRARGLRPIVLRAVEGWCAVGDAADAAPSLRFVLPAERAALRRLLAETRPRAAELHHLLGHDHSLVDLLRSLAIPIDIWVHDYAWFCARISFVTGEGRFCGEADEAACEICVGRWGRLIEDQVGAAALRARSAADLRAARAVIVPSADVARRVARHAPGVAPAVRPWQQDPPAAAPGLAWPGPASPDRALHVAVVGAIGPEKGFAVLLDCVRDAAARRLAIRFTVIGHTSDDDALLAAGPVFVTGEFAAAEADALIRAQGADLALLPSIWPETWCYALSDAWAAGLWAAVFDIGTPASRVRGSGRGWVLPLGLPAARVNDALLGLARARPGGARVARKPAGAA
jgi:GT2 family glycosyltransferase